MDLLFEAKKSNKDAFNKLNRLPMKYFTTESIIKLLECFFMMNIMLN